MPMEEAVEEIINNVRVRLQLRYDECKMCKYKKETHGMNCLECCPVEKVRRFGYKFCEQHKQEYLEYCSGCALDRRYYETY